jgi:hypothetical protein
MVPIIVFLNKINKPITLIKKIMGVKNAIGVVLLPLITKDPSSKRNSIRQETAV